MQKELSLIDLLHLYINSFFECPRVVVSENLKNLSGDLSSTPFRILKTFKRSPLFRRYNNVGKFSSSSLSHNLSVSIQGCVKTSLECVCILL